MVSMQDKQDAGAVTEAAPALAVHQLAAVASDPPPVQDALTRLLLRARLTRAEWETLRPVARVCLRETRHGRPYRYVAVILPTEDAEEAWPVAEGPNDAPGAVAWWGRYLRVRVE